MFKTLALSFALLTGSAAMAQTADAPQGRVADAVAGVAHLVPHQMAGPVKIRFRKLSDVALAATLATTPVEQKLAFRSNTKTLPID